MHAFHCINNISNEVYYHTYWFFKFYIPSTFILRGIPMDDLNVFRVFLAAAEAESFSKAAVMLGLTRSAVAKAIGRLEQRTSTRLFHRTTRVVALTDEGIILRERCAQTIQELEDTLSSLSDTTPEPRGVLRMTLPDGYGRVCVLPVLAQFLTKWPKLETEVSFNDRPVDMVAEGYDLALRIGAASADDDLISRVISRQRVIVCGSPTYLSQHGTPKTVADLAAHTCLQFSQRQKKMGWRFSDESGKDFRTSVKARLRFDSGEALCDAALLGLGLCQLPDFLLDKHIAAGRLQPVLTAHEPSPVPIVALYPTRKYLASKVRLFLDEISE